MVIYTLQVGKNLKTTLNISELRRLAKVGATTVEEQDDSEEYILKKP